MVACSDAISFAPCRAGELFREAQVCLKTKQDLEQPRTLASDARGTLLGTQSCRRTKTAGPWTCDLSGGIQCDAKPVQELSARSDSACAQVKGDNKYLMTLECEIPSCLEIRQTPYGLGVFATTHIPAGTEICCSKFHWIPDQEGEVLLRTQHGEHILEVHHHFPLLCTNLREVNYFDSFTNHSCDPNIFYDAIRHFEADPTSGDYKTFALKDISAGEQLTCDYDLFDWDSRDKAIVKCQCGAPCCRGSILGLQFRRPEDAVLHLAELEPITRQNFLQEHPEMVYEQMPAATWHANVSRRHNPQTGWQVMCERGANAGDFVLEGVSFMVDPSTVQTVALGFPFLEGTVNRAPQTVVFDLADIRLASVGPSSGKLEFFGICFSSDDSDVNAQIEFSVSIPDASSSRRSFRVVALKPIAVGDTLCCKRIV